MPKIHKKIPANISSYYAEDSAIYNWIEEIEVFDPVLKAIEHYVLERLSCKVLLVNEYGRGIAPRPTLFFMPHCHLILYDNLLEANWSSELLLNRVVIFGNSFKCWDFKTQNPQTLCYVLTR